MRIAFIVVAGMLVFLALWQGVSAQDEASSPCWTVVHGPIGFRIMGPSLSRLPASASPRAVVEVESAQKLEPEIWEAVLVNRCTGETWNRRSSVSAWEPISR